MKNRYSLFFHFLFLGVLVLLSTSASAQTRTLNLGTFYSSPVGVFDRITLHPRDPLPLPCELGTIYVEDLDPGPGVEPKLMFCTTDDLGNPTLDSPTIWSSKDTDGDGTEDAAVLNNLNLNVGIGTDTPTEALTIDGELLFSNLPQGGTGPSPFIKGLKFDHLNPAGLPRSARIGVYHDNDGTSGAAGYKIHLGHTGAAFIVGHPDRGLFVAGNNFVGINDPHPWIPLSVHHDATKGKPMLRLRSSDPAGEDALMEYSVDGAHAWLVGSVHELDANDGTGDVGDDYFAIIESLTTDPNDVKVVIKRSYGSIGIRDNHPDAQLEIAPHRNALDVVQGNYLHVSSRPQNDGDIFTVHRTGNIGIGTNSPQEKFVISNTTDQLSAPHITLENPNDTTGISTMDFRFNNFARARLTGAPDGTLEIAARRDLFLIAKEFDATPFKAISLIGDHRLIGFGTDTPDETTQGNNDPIAVFASNNRDISHYVYHNNPGSAPDFDFLRSRGTEGAKTNVQNGNKLGGIRFSGWRGGQFRLGAQILAHVDGAPANPMPTSLEFDVSGPAGPPEMMIRADGKVGIGRDNPSELLHVAGNAVFDGDILVNGTLYPSDANLKDNIHPINSALAKVNQIHGVTYDWKDETRGKEKQIGVLAQDVEKVLPEAVKDMNGHKAVDYQKLTPVLLEAVKELETLVTDLKAENAELKNRVSELEQNFENRM